MVLYHYRQLSKLATGDDVIDLPYTAFNRSEGQLWIAVSCQAKAFANAYLYFGYISIGTFSRKIEHLYTDLRWYS